MGNLHDLKAYLFVKQVSAFATVMHSPMKFAAISAATGHLQGRIIAFVGARTPTREPTPILLPQRKTWEWVKETVSSDGPAMFKFYDEDPSRAGTLWNGEGTEGSTRPQAPLNPFVDVGSNQAGREGSDAPRHPPHRQYPCRGGEHNGLRRCMVYGHLLVSVSRSGLHYGGKPRFLFS